MRGVQRYLRRLRLRLVTIHGARALLAGSAIGCVTFLGVSALAGPTTTPARSAASLALVGACALTTMVWLLRPLRGIRGARVARWLPAELASQARSALELARSKAEPELVRAHAIGVERGLGAHPIGESVPWGALVDPKSAIAAGVLAIGLGAFGLFDAASVGAFALLHPGARDEGRAVADVVAAATVEVSYPAYMRRPSETVDVASVLSLPIGTTVRFRLAPRFGLSEVAIRAPLQTARASEDGGIWSARFVVRESGPIHVDVTDRAGRALRDASQRRLEALSDAPPEVRLEVVETLTVVERSEPIPLAFTAADDLGLALVELVVETPAGVALRRELARFDDGAFRHSEVTQITAAEVGARAGDEVTLSIEARDHDDVSGPNIGQSIKWTVTVASEATRRQELVASLEGAVNLGLMALADRLENPTDDAVDGASVARRFARIEASGDAYEEVLGALSGRETPDLDASVLRTLYRRIGRALAQESRAHGDPPNPRAIRRSDATTVELLESQVLFLADLLESVRLEDAASITRELEELRREMQSLLAELRRTDSPEARRALMAALARAQARMRDLAQRLAAMGEEAPQEFTNSEGAPQEAAENALEQMRAAVERGDLDAAERHLLELEREIEQMARSLDGASAAHTEARFGPRERAMAEAIDRLEGLETEQRQLADRSESVRRSAADRALDGAGERAGEAAQRLSRRARESAADVAALPGSRLNPADRETHEQTRQRLIDMADALEQGDLGEARRMASEAQRDAERLARDLELSAMMFAGRDADGAEAADAARQTAREIDALSRALDDAIPDVASYVERAERAQLEEDSTNQQRAREAAQTLGELFAEEPDGAPLSPDGAEAMGRASDAMADATGSLRRGDPLAAARSQREAARELTELREKLEQQRQQEQSEGDGGGEGGESQPRERVAIPEIRGDADGQATRRALLDAMRRAAPAGYEDASRAYFEELLR